jgi:hypothetical protein
MNLLFPFPPELHQIDYLRAVFHLQFREDFILGPEIPLRLRRDLQRAERYAAERAGGRSSSSLLSPPLPDDPVALRRFQKPGPPFTLHPSLDPAGFYRTGACWRLPVLFFGRGVQQLAPFCDLLMTLGELGLHKCAGRFDVVAIEAESASGHPETIWQKGENLENLQVPINTLGYRLELSAVSGEAVRLTMQTPARLISASRPLFRPTFLQVLPFILRRVTSVLYACGTLELADAEGLLQAAGRVQETRSTLAWRDWRTLDGGEERVDLGGIVGSATLSGDGLPDILWLLNIGALCNMGKGATYGAGHYLLSKESDTSS